MKTSTERPARDPDAPRSSAHGEVYTDMTTLYRDGTFHNLPGVTPRPSQPTHTERAPKTNVTPVGPGTGWKKGGPSLDAGSATLTAEHLQVMREGLQHDDAQQMIDDGAPATAAEVVVEQLPLFPES